MKQLELDGEGVAFSKGLVPTSSARTAIRATATRSSTPRRHRDEIDARIAASSQIVRYSRQGWRRRQTRAERQTLRKIISSRDCILKGFCRTERLEENGVTVEGIAIKDDKTLFAGFRGPVLKGDEGKSRAVVLSAPLDALFDGGEPQHNVFRLPLRGPARGVRDLARL